MKFVKVSYNYILTYQPTKKYLFVKLGKRYNPDVNRIYIQLNAYYERLLDFIHWRSLDIVECEDIKYKSDGVIVYYNDEHYEWYVGPIRLLQMIRAHPGDRERFNWDNRDNYW
jgi:hypothetical protein